MSDKFYVIELNLVWICISTILADDMTKEVNSVL